MSPTPSPSSTLPQLPELRTAKAQTPPWKEGVGPSQITLTQPGLRQRVREGHGQYRQAQTLVRPEWERLQGSPEQQGNRQQGEEAGNAFLSFYNLPGGAGGRRLEIDKMGLGPGDLLKGTREGSQSGEGRRHGCWNPFFSILRLVSELHSFVMGWWVSGRLS